MMKTKTARHTPGSFFDACSVSLVRPVSRQPEQDDAAQDGKEDSDGDDDPEARLVARERYLDEVHAEEGGDKGRDRDDDGQDGESLHDDVEVVVDDGGEGVHHAGEKVGIDLAHLQGLVQFDGGVFHQVEIVLELLVGGRLEKTVEDVPVGMEGCGEVDEGLVDGHQLEQFLVAHGGVESLFDVVSMGIDPSQADDEVSGHLVYDLKGEADGFLRLDEDVPIHEVVDEGSAGLADGDEKILVVGDDERLRDVGLVAFVACQDRDVEDDKDRTAFVVDTCGLLLVEGGGKEVEGNPGLGADQGESRSLVLI